MNNKHTLSFGLRVCITYRAASLARRNLLLSATSDGLFMDELESITMTTSLNTRIYADSGCPFGIFKLVKSRRVWRYQRGNQNPYIEKEQTIQWPNEKVQMENPRKFVYSHFRCLRLNLICTFVNHLLWSVHVYDDK
jgi:hypothetical protein